MDKVAIMNAAREKYRLQHLNDVRKKAKEDFERFKDEALFTAGIMLYYGEGRKITAKSNELGLTNAEPSLLQIYCNFVRRYFEVNEKKIHARVFLYPDLDVKKVHSFWSQVLNIPLKQFIKHTLLESRSNLTTNKLPYGTCCVYVSSRDMCDTMQVWINKLVEILRR